MRIEKSFAWPVARSRCARLPLLICGAGLFALLPVRVGWAADLEPIAPPAENFRLGHPSPSVARVDQSYLMRFVRRVLVWRLQGQSYEPAFTPPALAELRCRASVTLRRHGRALGSGDSDALPVIEACQVAAEAALERSQGDAPLTAEAMAGIRIEVELIGPRERVGDGHDSVIGLAVCFEPAVHGIAVRFDEEETLVRPSQLVSKESLCPRGSSVTHDCDRYETVIGDFRRELGLTRDPPARDPATVVFLRFRTTHLFEPAPGADPIHLVAGLRVIQPAELTGPCLTAVADDLATYIRHRQISDGLFAYEFLPGRDMYWPESQSWVRQAGTTWALAVHARQRGDQASRQAVDRAIMALAKMIKPLEGHHHAAYVATPDGLHPLGLTALLCLAMLDGPEPDRYADLRAPLLNGLVAMQQADGRFRTHFPPATRKASEDYYPGQALLAIVRHYARDRDSKWREICDRALTYYKDYFSTLPPAPFIPWQVQAWGQMARVTRLQKYADFVYEMSDALAPAQLVSDDPTLRIYDGAFDVSGTGRAGISTGVYVEGFVDAARTAVVMGDFERAEHYRRIVSKGIRFVVQLRFREEEAYYVLSPVEVIGAVRSAPANPTLRIDHCQHALAALLGAIELMPPETQPAGSGPPP